MSFIVSYNGQFKPYILPDLTHYDRIRHVFKSGQLHSLKTDDKTPDFKEILNTRPPTHNEANQKVSSTYEQQSHNFHKESIPHHARDLMNSNLKVLIESQTVQDANSLMDKYRFRHTPVLNQDQVLVGIISDRDLTKVQDSTKLSAIMTKEVLTCLESTRIQDIAKIMVHEKISAIPIINDKHQLVGIITQTDILNFVTKILSINALF